eukprot:scaffold11887_cov38-Tisochrysis_lutea.AAC.3
MAAPFVRREPLSNCNKTTPEAQASILKALRSLFGFSSIASGAMYNRVPAAAHCTVSADAPVSVVRRQDAGHALNILDQADVCARATSPVPCLERIYDG